MNNNNSSCLDGFNITKYSLTDEELVFVERALETISRTKDFGDRDMESCKLESFLKEKANSND